MDIESLDAGQDFSELPETYVIFITEKDIFGMGEPIYPIERMNLKTGKPFEDGEHILYVNGEYRGDTDIGKLMHDFSCAEASRMKIPLMAERTRYLKESEEGVTSMCKVVEEMVEEGIKLGEKRGLKTVALRMLEDGAFPLEEISKMTGLSLDEIKKLQ